jgi:glycosyltransferase involved in cell wall biosynthesis
VLVVLNKMPTPYRTAFFDVLYEESTRIGVSFRVLYCAQTEPDRHWAYEPEKMHHPFTMMRGFHPSFTGLHAHINPAILSELNRLKPDTLIVAGAWNTPTMLLAGWDPLSSSKRKIFWSEGHADAVLNRGGVIAWARRVAYRLYDGYAVPNQLSAEWALAQAGESRPLYDLPNSIDASYYAKPDENIRQEARLKLGLKAQTRALVQVSSLTQRKGVVDLAKAFIGLPADERRGARLFFVGSGDRETEIRSLAASSGGAIQLLGQLPPDEVRQTLWAADGFILNTRLDPNPLSVIEAAAAGLPIALSKFAGNIGEVVTRPGAGFVISDPSNPADALREMLASTDQELEQMGRRAAEVARNQFDTRAVARLLLRQLYKARVHNYTS